MDFRTLLVTLALLRVLQATALLYIWRSHPGHTSARDWASGSVLVAAGSFLVALRGAVPDLLSIVGGNLCIFSGILLFDAGILRACGALPPWRAAWGALAAALIALSWFTYADPSTAKRIVIFAALICTYDLYAAAKTAMARSATLRTQRVIAGLLALEALIAAIRAVDAVRSDLTSVLHSTPTQTAFLLLAITTTFLITLALAILTSEQQLQSRLRSEEALRLREEWLSLIADNVPALVGYIDRDERYAFANRLYHDWLGFPRESLLGRTVRDLWGEARYRELKPNIDKAIRGEHVESEYTVEEQGKPRRILASYVPHTTPAGEVRGFFVLGSDVTALAAARTELQAARDRLERALDGSSVALWDADLRGGRVQFSEAWGRIVGASSAETLTTVVELAALVHPEDVERTMAAYFDTVKGVQPLYKIDHRVKSAGGEWKWVHTRGRVTERDRQSGRALRVIGTSIEITDRKRVEEMLQSAAHTDALTGLVNRPVLLDRLRSALTRAKRNGSPPALLYVDVDRFKEVNDTFGHAAGDEVLRHVTRCLQASVREADTVARLGGDEFVVLLEDAGKAVGAERVAREMLAALREPARIDGRPVAVTASIGIAVGLPEDDGESLLKRADSALYKAKNAGRSTYSSA